jgi:very-short-patch-repair endonuclease
MSTEVGNAVSRVVDCSRVYFECAVARECERLAKYCESPIEVMLGAAFCIRSDLGIPGFAVIVPPGQDHPKPGKHRLLIHPQYEWESYRIDFAFDAAWGKTVFVECDGHDFHERTKEQAERDRAKDRRIQEAGITIFRFTGSEIYRDPANCAEQVINFLAKSLPPK